MLQATGIEQKIPKKKEIRQVTMPLLSPTTDLKGGNERKWGGGSGEGVSSEKKKLWVEGARKGEQHFWNYWAEEESQNCDAK